MTTALVLLSLGLPLALALLLGSRLRWLALALVPTAALPALFVAFHPGVEVTLPWLLLGTRLGVDATGAVFMLLAGVLWTAAGIYARGYLAGDPEQARFAFFYLLTCAGSLGVILALDTASFYLFFALMTFAAYGLIVHDGSAQARRAGRVYLVLAVPGEMLLLVATLLIVAVLGNADLRELGALLVDVPRRDLIVGLVLVGFAIKMGAVPLHVWLPLAHPCAPTPASAVLSGIIIKAGLLGWLRFLPLGEVALPGWAELCVWVGLGSTFYAVLVGVPQERPKTVLAYSSISQMGLLTVLIGMGLAAPGQWPVIAGTVALFALHHGLAKGALFLGAGLSATGRPWVGWGLVLPALALAGAPLSSGFLVKLLVKDLAPLAPGDLAAHLPLVLNLSSAATTVLMIRFLYLAWPRGATTGLSAWTSAPWLVLLAATACLPWWWASVHVPGALERALDPGGMVAGLWPLLLAGGVALVAGAVLGRLSLRWRLPEGDIVDPLERLAGSVPRRIEGRAAGRGEPPTHDSAGRTQAYLQRTERLLRLWPVAGAAMLVAAMGLFGLLWTG